MKLSFMLLATFAFLGLTACNSENAKVTAQQNKTESIKEISTKKDKTPILVELFTSEGCSSCPPADRVLAKLQSEQPIENAEIITLAFHVDYWNYLGWKDEFSSAEYSQRQNEYSNALNVNSNYTPQMIVDGKSEFIGSKETTARNKISEAVNNKKAEVELSFEKDFSNLKVQINEVSVSEDSDVWLAIAEDNLETSIKSGENAGRKLQHTSVVREFKNIGNIASSDKTFETETAIKIKSGWKKENLKLVVFVQSKHSMEIIGLNFRELK